MKEKRWAWLALLLLVPVPSLGVLVPLDWPGAFGQGFYIAAKVWLAALPVVWWAFVLRKRISLSPAKQGGFGVGIALGLLISAIIIAAYWLVGHQLIDAPAMREVAATNGLDQLWKYLLLATYLTTINSLMEEYVWRWFVFRQFEQYFHKWTSVVLAALAFTLHHTIALWIQFGPWIALIGSAGVFIGGATWSWLYMKYRSVWPAYVSHAIVDVAVFLVGYWVIFG